MYMTVLHCLNPLLRFSVSVTRLSLHSAAQKISPSPFMMASRDGSWYRCADGSIMDQLDFIHLVFFPYQDYNVSPGENVCFKPRHFQLPIITNLLPEQTTLFSPDDLVDGTIALIIFSTFVMITMILLRYIWDILDPHFNAISPAHKKWYVVANISKGFWLACLALSPKYWIGTYNGQMFDEFQLIELKRCIAIYISTDLVALFMVPKLPLSTIMHHVAVTVLSLFVFGVNLQVKGYANILGLSKMLLAYGACSTIPFSVNLYLALRVVYAKSVLVKLLCYIGLLTYLMCCLLNWSIHGLWLMGFWAQRDFSIYTIFYTFMLIFLVRDDIILIKWLLRQSSPMATDKIKNKKE